MLFLGIGVIATARSATCGERPRENEEKARRHSNEHARFSDPFGSDGAQDPSGEKGESGAVEPQPGSAMTREPGRLRFHDGGDPDASATVGPDDSSGGEFRNRSDDEATECESETGEEHTISET